MPTYYWDADKDALLRRTRGISLSIPDQSKPPPGAIDQDDPWPFDDPGLSHMDFAVFGMIGANAAWRGAK